MSNLRSVRIFGLFALFLLIVIPFAVAQDSSDNSEEIADNVADAKDTREAIKERFKRIPAGGIGVILKGVTGEIDEGKPYTIGKDKAPVEEDVVTKGKDYVAERNGKDRKPASITELIEGVDYSSALITTGKTLTMGKTTSELVLGGTRDVTVGKGYLDILGTREGAKTRRITAASATSGLILGDMYNPIVGKEYIDLYEDIRTPRVTAASAMGEMYMGKDYPSMISDTTEGKTPAYTFMGSQITSPVGEYMVGMKDIGVDMMSFFKNNMHIAFIFAMFLITMIIAIKTKRR